MTLLAGLAAGATIMGAEAHAFSSVKLDRDVAGVVTLVNQQGTSVCLNEDAGGNQLCTDALLRPGASPIVVGQRLAGTLMWVPIANGRAQLMVVTSQQNAP